MLRGLPTVTGVGRPLNLSPTQQSCSSRHLDKSLMFTLLKEMNIFLSWKALKTLWQRQKMLLQEQFRPLSQWFQMSSAAADVKTREKWRKGLMICVNALF